MSGTTKGTISSWLSEFPEEVPAQIAIGINRLGRDGGFDDVHTFYRFYRLPEGANQDNRIDPKEWIQTAGTAARLTVEIKRREADGSYRQYVVGCPSAAGEPAESDVVQFGDHQVSVRPSEVLTAQDAIGIFQHYYDHHAIPEGWHLRELPEYADTSEQNAAASASATDGAQPAPGAVAGRAESAAPGKSAQADVGDQRRQAGGA